MRSLTDCGKMPSKSVPSGASGGLRWLVRLAGLGSAVLFFGMVGCASMGHNFDASKVSELKPGVSTEADAVKMMGAEPTSRTFRSDGSYMASWQYVSVATFAGTTDNKLLHLNFDKNKVFTQMVSYTDMKPK